MIKRIRDSFRNSKNKKTLEPMLLQQEYHRVMELPLDPQMLLMKSNNNSLPFRAYGDEMANKNGQEEMISEIRRSEYNPLNDFPTVVGY